MPARIIFSADDFGRTEGVTNGILAAIDHGIVEQVSVLANGDDARRAYAELIARPSLLVRLHLNLTEGKPLSNPEALPHLVNESGFFSNSFPGLLFRYLLAESDIKEAFEREVLLELRAQVAAVREGSKRDRIGIDGHYYVHVIPWIYRLIIRNASDLGISEMRGATEPFSLPLTHFKRPIALFSNYIKWTVHTLCLLVAKRNIIALAGPSALSGIIASGNIDENALRASAAAAESTDVLEVVVHPGGALATERHLFDGALSRYAAFNFSAGRLHERVFVTDPRTRELVAELILGAGVSSTERLSAIASLLIKFGITGATAACVHVTGAAIALSLGAIPVIATAIGFLAAFGVSFTLQKYWTFEDGSRERLFRQATQFLVTGIFGTALNMYGTHVLVEVIGLPALLGIFIASLMVSVATFGIYKFVIFRS